MQISAVNYSTNTLTVADFTRAEGEYVWLYKKSDGTVVLKGSAPDAGAYEADSMSASITGTATVGINESDIVTGSKDIVIELSNDTWVADGATFEAQRQNIIDGMDSNRADAAGWDAVVVAELAVTTVVRTSDTIVTITLPDFDGDPNTAYDISQTEETVTITIPATAVTSATEIVASPTFSIGVEAAGGSSTTGRVGAYSSTGTKGIPSSTGITVTP